MSPVIYQKKGSHKELLEKLFKNGFLRIKVNDEILLIEDVLESGLDKNKKHTIYLIIDRIILKKENNDRIVEALELANKYSDGIINIQINNDNSKLFIKE